MEILNDPSTLVLLVLALSVAGAAIGLLAGLFGIGGGAISVPVFYEVFTLLGHPPEIAMPTAIGTSLAVIIPTSISSARLHHKRGTVDMDVLRVWAVPVVIGTLVGSAIARYAPPQLFQLVFILVAGINATKLLTGGAGWRLRDGLPKPGPMRIYGGVLGVLSALMGIGGGAIANLILTLHGVTIHRAVSTAAGVGVLIAIPGTLGYMGAGWGRPGLLPDAIGFVSLMTFALTIPMSLVTTRFGVALAHRLSRRALETAFALFLVLVCLRFLWAMLTGG